MNLKIPIEGFFFQHSSRFSSERQQQKYIVYITEKKFSPRCDIFTFTLMLFFTRHSPALINLYKFFRLWTYRRRNKNTTKTSVVQDKIMAKLYFNFMIDEDIEKNDVN
jgi:hypothetical protein